MTDAQYIELTEFRTAGAALIPTNAKAKELVEQTQGRVINLKPVIKRDIRYHRAYFKLLAFIWEYGTPAFKQAIPVDKFYIFLKMLTGSYDVVFEFKDGRQLIEYHSISFGKMSQEKFEAYVREQLPIIYTGFIGVMYKDTETVSLIIECIEHEFENFLQ